MRLGQDMKVETDAVLVVVLNVSRDGAKVT